MLSLSLRCTIDPFFNTKFYVSKTTLKIVLNSQQKIVLCAIMGSVVIWNFVILGMNVKSIFSRCT